MKQCMDADNLHRRLKKIQGQIAAIIMEGHIQHCVRDGIEHGDADKTIAEFTKVIEQFSKI